MTDARFEDGGDQPLRLKALDADDLQVLASLCQDAVLTGGDISFRAKDRRLALLINRMRWEDAPGETHPAERVRAMLVAEDVLSVRSQGIAQGDSDTVLSLLDVQFEPGEDGTGTLRLIFAGDGLIEAQVEALELVLRDVTRPYVANSRHVPDHGI